MTRKLVTLRKIKELLPIEGADFIELAKVDGWQVVVKKGEFKVGDVGYYFEIDSFLPLEPEFEFLRKSSYKKMLDKEGLRLKTIRLRKKLSQGLLLPYKTIQRFFIENPFNLKIIPNKDNFENDFSELFGVEKYELPIPANLSGTVAGDFPYFIPKTDEERIQNLWDEYNQEFSNNNEVFFNLDKNLNFKEKMKKMKEIKDNRKINPIKNLEFEATIKLDGSSMTSFIIDTNKYETKSSLKLKNEHPNKNYYYGVCSRNLELKETKNNTFWQVFNKQIKENLLSFFKKTNRSIALQGELMGEGIQGNREKIKGHEFFNYKIFDIDKQEFLIKSERDEILKELNIKSVPFIENIKPFKVFKNIDEILEYANGKSLNNSIREGVVFKSLKLIDGKEISFKSISNQYLLKGGN